jgi:hypothetical protein
VRFFKVTVIRLGFWPSEEEIEISKKFKTGL